MLQRLFPPHADNRFQGLRPSLWLLGLLLFLKLLMSFNSIFNTESVAVGADGIPLASYGPDAAREVLMLFALMALGHLAITLIGLVVLIRYRALVPLIYLVLLGEMLARRAIVWTYSAPGAKSAEIALLVNYGLLAFLALGLALSLVPARRERRAADGEDAR